jgi:putative ABC transport system permease protein
MIWRRTALGWIQLTHNKARLFTAIAGVAFAAILLFMQLGFRNMLLDTTVMLHKRLNADIVLVSTKARDMNSPGTFPRRRLAQALGVHGVVEGEALYVMTRDMIVPSGPRQGERAPMLVLGVRPDFNAFKDPEITQNQPLLTVSGTVLFDRGSRFDYTALKASVVRDERPTVELGGKTATIEGLFHIGSSFGNEGNIVTSEE